MSDEQDNTVTLTPSLSLEEERGSGMNAARRAGRACAAGARRLAAAASGEAALHIGFRPRRACAPAVHHSPFIIHHSRQGFTLVEMLVVAGIIAILLTLAIVSLRSLTGGVQEGNARTVLKTVLASARADAAVTGHLVGVRFQQYRYPPIFTSSIPGGRPSRQAEDGATYGVIVYPATATAAGLQAIERLRDLVGPALAPRVADIAGDLFVAADGREPCRFPAGVELAVNVLVNRDANAGVDDNDGNLSLSTYLQDCTRFTILFSPNGQAEIRPVFVIQRTNRDSLFYGPDYNQLTTPLPDFAPRPNGVVPMVLPDDRMFVDLTSAATWAANPPAFLSSRYSQSSVWLYDQVARKQAALPWTNYLKTRYANGAGDVFILINPYTGQLQKPSG